MKKVFTFLLLTILSLTFRIDAFALDKACTQTEQLRLRELVNATQITYEFYEEKSDEGFFQGYRVSVSNFKPDFYIYDEKQSTYFKYDGDSIATAGYFLGGITYSLPFYAAKGSACEGYLIMTKALQLVPYNPYSEDPLCKGHETYELCKKFTPIKLSSQIEFEQRMRQYLKSLEDDKQEEKPPIEEDVSKTILDVVVDFIIDYYMVILITIAVSGTIGIIIIRERQRRSIL